MYIEYKKNIYTIDWRCWKSHSEWYKTDEKNDTNLNRVWIHEKKCCQIRFKLSTCDHFMRFCDAFVFTTTFYDYVMLCREHIILGIQRALSR